MHPGSVLCKPQVGENPPPQSKGAAVTEPLRLLWLHIDQSKLYAVMIGSLPSFTSLKYS